MILGIHTLCGRFVKNSRTLRISERVCDECSRQSLRYGKRSLLRQLDTTSEFLIVTNTNVVSSFIRVT